MPILKDLTAMLEYTLIAFNKTGRQEQFYREMLSPELSKNSFSGKLLRELFNNDIIDRYFIGRGRVETKEDIPQFDIFDFLND